MCEVSSADVSYDLESKLSEMEWIFRNFSCCIYSTMDTDKLLTLSIVTALNPLDNLVFQHVFRDVPAISANCFGLLTSDKRCRPFSQYCDLIYSKMSHMGGRLKEP